MTKRNKNSDVNKKKILTERNENSDVNKKKILTERNENSDVNKNKILTRRNENSDVVEQNSVVWSSSFGSKAVKFPVVGDVEGEVDDDEGDESEDDEEEVVVECEKDRFWSLKGLLKWSLVVVALVLMTQGICSLNLSTDSDTLEPVGDFSDWYFVNRAAGLNFFEAEESINIVMGFKDRAYVYGAASVDYSRIGTGPVRDADLEARRFEKVEGENALMDDVVVETVEESAVVENGLIDDVVVETVEESDVVENGLIDYVVVETVKEPVEVESGLIDEKDVVDDEMLSKQENSGHLQLTETLLEQEIAESEVLEIDTDVILDDMWSKQEHTHHLQRVDELQEHESAETEVMEIDDIEVKREVSDQLLTADFDQDGFGEDMNVAEKVIGDIKPSELASSDPAVTVLTRLVILLLMSVGVVYHLKRMKSTPAVTTPIEKKDIKEAEPSTNSSSLIQQKEEETMSVTSAAPKEELSKETSHVNAPSVELLGEFVFGEELTSSVRSDNILPEANASNSLIQTSSVSFSQTTTSHLEISTRTARKPCLSEVYTSVRCQLVVAVTDHNWDYLQPLSVFSIETGTTSYTGVPLSI
ncbi:hypothetical protein Tco_1101663 [Tanacetum coccineum]